MKKRAIILVAVLTVGSMLVATANASIFRYQRLGTTIDGHIRNECGYQCMTNWHRAGSGNGGTSECAYGNWIPVGTYNVEFHANNYDGSLIKGRVWKISNHPCSNGVTRTDLFVHSEETAANGQTCGTPYDQRWCWDGPSDYYSEGCIKIARQPIGADGLSDLGRLNNWAATYPVTQVYVDP
jgi:hypothetical protein